MVLASDVPFLRRVPNIGAHTIYVSPDPHARMGAIRAMIRHLEAGGAVMTFGSGLVDPDPDLLPGAAEALEIWYESLAIVLRRVPQTQVVVSIVSSVVAPQYMRSPLTRLKQDGWERRKLAEFLQIGSQLMFSKKALLTPRVSFSQPIIGRRPSRGTRAADHHAADHRAGQGAAGGAHGGCAEERRSAMSARQLSIPGRPKPYVMAHRGNSAACPENTLAAFAARWPTARTSSRPTCT